MARGASSSGQPWSVVVGGGCMAASEDIAGSRMGRTGGRDDRRGRDRVDLNAPLGPSSAAIPAVFVLIVEAHERGEFLYGGWVSVHATLEGAKAEARSISGTEPDQWREWPSEDVGRLYGDFHARCWSSTSETPSAALIDYRPLKP